MRKSCFWGFLLLCFFMVMCLIGCAAKSSPDTSSQEHTAVAVVPIDDLAAHQVTPGDQAATKSSPTPEPTATPAAKKPDNFGAAVTETVKEQVIKSDAKQVDLVLCIDTSESMESLSYAAKKKLMSIIDEVKNLEQKPDVRVAIVTYGSEHIGLVHLEIDLTDDMVKVQQKLNTLRCQGGKEYVARVIDYSLDNLSWNKGPGTLRTIFVAGNEGVHQDPDLKIPPVCQKAVNKSTIINTLYCGLEEDLKAAQWKEVARLGKGRFYAIYRTMGQQNISTTSDENVNIGIRGKVTATDDKNQKVTIVDETSGTGEGKTFTYNSKTYFSPPSWRPGRGDQVYLFYRRKEPGVATQLQDRNVKTYEGRVAAKKGANQLTVKEKEGAGSLLFKPGSATGYHPDSWRPQKGDMLRIQYSTQERIFDIYFDQYDSVDGKIVASKNNEITIKIVNTTRTFKIDQKTNIRPQSWRPKTGDLVDITYENRTPDRIYSLRYRDPEG